MCNIVLANRDFYISHTHEYWELTENALHSCGGDGQGIACLLPDGDSKGLKRHDVLPEELQTFTQNCIEEGALWVLWHTRKATTAPLYRNDLCQPFVNTHFTMAHVGTVHALDVWKDLGITNEETDIYGPVSDGYMLNELMSMYSSNPFVDAYRAVGGEVAGWQGLNVWLAGSFSYTFAPGESGMCFHTGPSRSEELLTVRFLDGLWKHAVDENSWLKLAPVRRETTGAGWTRRGIVE